MLSVHHQHAAKTPAFPNISVDKIIGAGGYAPSLNGIRANSLLETLGHFTHHECLCMRYVPTSSRVDTGLNPNPKYKHDKADFSVRVPVVIPA